MHRASSWLGGDENWIAALRKQLPLTQERIYLDSAGCAPLAGFVREAIEDCLSARDRGGKAGVKEHASLALPRARAGAGQLFGCRPDEVAFVRNTTEGLSLVAQGLRWRYGDNLVLAERDFPANVYPWLALRRRGVEVRVLPAPGGRIGAPEIAAALNGRTRVVSLSQVDYVTGARRDLEAIGATCNRRGVRLVVDAAQSAGALDLDVAAIGAAAVATSGWKWLLGPVGVGLLHCASWFVDELDPVVVGAGSMEGGEAEEPRLPFSFRPGALRFEYSTPDFAGIAGLGAALAALIDIGIRRIEARVVELASLLADELRRGGLELLADQGGRRAVESGIVTFRAPAGRFEQIRAALAAARVDCTTRDRTVRLSPHAFNTTDEIARALRAVIDRKGRHEEHDIRQG